MIFSAGRETLHQGFRQNGWFSAALLAVIVIATAVRMEPELLGGAFGGYGILTVLLIVVTVSAFFPWLALLLAIASLPIDLSIAVPHSVSSAPSDYLVIGAALGSTLKFLDALRRSAVMRFGFAGAVLPALALFVAIIAALGVLEGDLLKLGLAEVIGLGFAGAYMVLIGLYADCRERLRDIAAAATVGLAIAVFGASIVGTNSIACLPGTSFLDNFHVLYRVAALSADPNVFSVQIIILTLVAAVGLGLTPARDSGTGVSRMLTLALLCAAPFMVLLTASRTGQFLLLPLAASCLVAAFWHPRIGLIGICAATAYFSTSFVWSHLPCTFEERTAAFVGFDERNDPEAYFRRILETADVEFKTDQTLVLQDDRHALFLEKFAAWRAQRNRPPSKSELMAIELRIRSGSPVRTTDSSDDQDKDITDTGSTEMRAGVLRSFHTVVVARTLEAIKDLPLDAARLRLWKEGLLLSLYDPVFGVGPGSMPSFTAEGNRAHNWYISMLAEAGYVGLFGFLAPLAVSMGLAVFAFCFFPSLRAAALLAATSVATAGAALLAQDTGRQGIIWITFGIALALARIVERQNAQKRRAAMTDTATAS